jgi:hypothetical protein
MTSSSTSSRTGPCGARERAATTGPGSGATSGASLAVAGPRPVGLARTCQQGPVKDSRTRHQRSAPCRCTAHFRMAGYPLSAAEAVCCLTVGSRVAPLAIMGSAVRPDTRQGSLRCRSDRASSRLDPRRTDPEVGGYRGDAQNGPPKLGACLQEPRLRDATMTS